MLTDKPLSNGSIANKTTVSVVRITLRQSPIQRAQVQVDSIIIINTIIHR